MVDISAKQLQIGKSHNNDWVIDQLGQIIF